MGRVLEKGKGLVGKCDGELYQAVCTRQKFVRTSLVLIPSIPEPIMS